MHERGFGEADAVLAAQGASQIDGDAEDLFDRFVADLELLGIAAVDHDIGVHVAVACMAETGDLDVVFERHVVDTLKQFGQHRPGHGDILVDLLAAIDRDRLAGVAPGEPEVGGLGVVARFFELAATVFQKDLFDHVHLVIDLFGQIAVDVGDQNGTGIDRQSLVILLLHGTDGEVVQKLHRHRCHAACHRLVDRLHRTFDAWEDPHGRFFEFGFGDQLEGDFGDDRQCPFAGDQDAGDVVARHVLDCLLPGTDDIAVGAHGADCHDVVFGDAVFGRPHAAGVFADVPADGAVFLTRRVGRVEEPFGFDRLLKLHVDDARLDDGDHVVHVDFENLVHMFFQCQDDAAVGRKCATGKAASRTARNDRDTVFVAVFQNGAHIRFVPRKENGVRLVTLARRIVGVGDHVGFVVIEVFLADNFFQGHKVGVFYHFRCSIFL